MLFTFWSPSPAIKPLHVVPRHLFFKFRQMSLIVISYLETAHLVTNALPCACLNSDACAISLPPCANLQSSACRVHPRGCVLHWTCSSGLFMNVWKVRGKELKSLCWKYSCYSSCASRVTTALPLPNKRVLGMMISPETKLVLLLLENKRFIYFIWEAELQRGGERERDHSFTGSLLGWLQ